MGRNRHVDRLVECSWGGSRGVNGPLSVVKIMTILMKNNNRTQWCCGMEVQQRDPTTRQIIPNSSSTLHWLCNSEQITKVWNSHFTYLIDEEMKSELMYVKHLEYYLAQSIYLKILAIVIIIKFFFCIYLVLFYYHLIWVFWDPCSFQYASTIAKVLLISPGPKYWGWLKNALPYSGSFLFLAKLIIFCVINRHW